MATTSPKSMAGPRATTAVKDRSSPTAVSKLVDEGAGRSALSQVPSPLPDGGDAVSSHGPIPTRGAYPARCSYSVGDRGE